MKRIRIGTRGSSLALWQANWVRGKLESIFPHCKFEVINIKTQGDRDSHIPLERIGGEGVFVKQIEFALLDGEIDLAVHSMKDLPTVLPDGLMVGAVPERADPADVLISKHDEQRAKSRERRVTRRRGERATRRVPASPRPGVSASRRLRVSPSPCRSSLYALCPMLYHLPQGAKIGTGSLRRRAQLLYARSDLVIMDIRGNVDTRLAKLRSGDLDAIVLAAASLERLGAMETGEHGDAGIRKLAASLPLLSPRMRGDTGKGAAPLFAQRLPYSMSLPAVGQGALCVEIRAEDKELSDMVKSIDHPESAAAVRAERAFLRELGGGCRVPIAALCTVDSGELDLVGLVADRDGRRVVRSSISGRQEEAEHIGKKLAKLLLDSFYSILVRLER